MTSLTLLAADGSVTTAELNESPGYAKPESALQSRVAYAAAHVVPKTWADNTPGQPADVDWDATLAFRRHVYSWGLGVADAMDTAQRNMGLDAAATRELIARSAQVAREEGGSVVVGVNTDHVDDESISVDAVIDAYKEQLHFTEEQGAGPVLMASRHLARAAASADDYRRVYREVLSTATTPVVLHWLGTAFDPSLEGYFGSPDWDAASQVLLEIIAENTDKVAGVKMSLLDAAAEVSVRDRLPEGVRMFTGDDFNYVGLIGGDSLDGASTAVERPSGPLRRAARRVRRDHPGRLGGHPGARRRRPRPLPRDPRADRGAQPAGLRRADLLLQDGRRVPVVAERSPVRVPDGGRSAFGAEPPASVADRRARERVPRARAARARRGALAWHASREWHRCSGSALMTTSIDPAFGRLRDRRVDRRLSINQATIKYADLATALRVTAEAGVEAIGLWREPVHEVGLDVATRMLADSGLRFSTYCRGGFFTVPEGPDRRAAMDDNRRAIDETATLAAAGASGSKAILVLVAGGLPDGSRDLVGARERVRDAIGELAPAAAAAGVTLAIEPLHPMYVSDRAVVSTLGQALDIAADFDPSVVGVTVDTFHVFWDPDVLGQIARAGREGRIATYQVCDWKTPLAADVLLVAPLPGRRRHRLRVADHRGRGCGLRRRRRGRDLQRGRVGDRPPRRGAADGGRLRRRGVAAPSGPGRLSRLHGARSSSSRAAATTPTRGTRSPRPPRAWPSFSRRTVTSSGSSTPWRGWMPRSAPRTCSS